MVEWCTQKLCRDSSISRGTSHATTKERYQYTTSVNINNTRYKRIQSLIQNHTRHVRSESAREQRIELYKVINLVFCAQSTITVISGHALYKSYE